MSADQPLRVTAIVVSYNTREYLADCLRSLEGQADEVIVVDNASTDGSGEMVSREFPAVRLFCNTKNRGFGAANNQGLEVMTGDAALLLNSDATAEPGAVGVLASALQTTPGAVAVGGQLRGAKGEIQDSCANPLTPWAVVCEQLLLEKAFPRSPFFSPYWSTKRLSGPGPHRVGQVMGACVLFHPRERFDERFFLYVEDTDLCDRLSAYGDIFYVPEARFGHVLGASSSGQRWWSVAMYNHGKEMYFWVRGRHAVAVFTFVLNRAGALLRCLIWSVLLRPKQTWLFLRVLFAPIRGPRRPADAE